jgi:(2Fe-2S) ferredoxin
VPHGRLLFVRRPDRRGRPELVAFTAASRPGQTSVTTTEFEAYEDLRGLDLLAGTPVEHPIFLVCTHGKHDPCCARFGRPLYEALRDELAPDWVWQVSHIGGDRFAGNLVCLPEGLYYGRVDRETAGPVLDEHLARRILIPSYRGRSIYTFAVQAAERVVRERTGLVGIDDLTLRGVVRRNASTRVTFAAGAETHELVVDEERGDLTRLTCSSVSLERPPRLSSDQPDPQQALAHEAPDEHEPALLIEPPREVGGREGPVDPEHVLELGGDPRREAQLLSFEGEPRLAVVDFEVGDDGFPALELVPESRSLSARSWSNTSPRIVLRPSTNERR